jgi:transcriptional regulator with XRE-family HTH domain
MKTIVKRLENYRLEKKITQERLAAELDVAFCTVNRWFRGKNSPNKIQEYHIAKLILKKGV